MDTFMMNWADWLIIAIIVISSLISLKRGFIKEALSLVTWVAAFIVARLFTDNLSVLLADYIDTPSARIVAAFALLFIMTLFAGALLNKMVCALVIATGLSGTDRALGMIFGIARGGVLIVVMVTLLGMSPVIQDHWWRESTLIPHFLLMEEWTRILGRETSQFILGFGQ
jgi:membrane protein required for colicin V production